MKNKITFKGNPVTLVGREVRIDSGAPDFRATLTDMKEATIKSFDQKIKLITSFLSLDTPVCDLQVKEFNKRASTLSSDIVIIAISKDLPFAQKRFCESFDIKNLTLASDYRFSSFGLNYGLLVKELNLLARAVLIVDKANILRYMEIVEELTHPPRYEEALKNLESVIAAPKILSKEELPGHCVPCEGGVPPLPKEKVERLLSQYRGWQLIEDKKITKEFKFKDFVEAKYFLDLVSIIAEEQGHHPTMTLAYNRLKITFTTHAAGGLTDNDFIMAKIIDELKA